MAQKSSRFAAYNVKNKAVKILAYKEIRGLAKQVSTSGTP